MGQDAPTDAAGPMSKHMLGPGPGMREGGPFSIFRGKGAAMASKRSIQWLRFSQACMKRPKARSMAQGKRFPHVRAWVERDPQRMKSAKMRGRCSAAKRISSALWAALNALWRVHKLHVCPGPGLGPWLPCFWGLCGVWNGE